MKKNDYLCEIKHIIDYESTRSISYTEYKKAYDYVDKRFPNLNIKDVVIYLYDRNNIFGILSKKGSCGFYSVILDTIFVANRGEDSPISIDETIVHELLHYVSFHDNSDKMNALYEEYFSYANSLEYFTNKGWSDEDLVSKYLFPFFKTICSKKVAMDKAKHFLKEHIKKDLPTNKNDFLNIL